MIDNRIIIKEKKEFDEIINNIKEHYWVYDVVKTEENNSYNEEFSIDIKKINLLDKHDERGFYYKEIIDNNKKNIYAIDFESNGESKFYIIVITEDKEEIFKKKIENIFKKGGEKL